MRTRSTADDRPEENLPPPATAPGANWWPIATAPKSGYVLGAMWDGKWYFAEIFNEWDEWVDVRSDRIHSPVYWTYLPDDLRWSTLTQNEG